MFSVGGVMILFLLLFATQVELSKASGTGKIKFVRFKYSSCGDASGDCDFYFTNIKIVGGDGVEHTIDRKTAPANTNNVDLTTVIPGATTVALSASRPVRLTMDIRESDLGADDDVININQDVTFPEIEQGDNWVNKKHTYLNGAELTLSRRITSCDTNFTGPGCNSCKTNHYTSTCDRYCAPVTGNYTCNSNGNKVCETWKTGANCDQCVTGRKSQDCGQCDNDYYGTNCSVHCQKVPGHYSCSDEGAKVCEKQWTGTDCSACSTGYYGNSCSVYCSPTEYYNCTETGEKVCSSGNITLTGSRCEASGLDLKLIGGAGGGIVFLIVFIIATVYLVRRRKSGEETSDKPIANPAFRAATDTLEIPTTQNPVYTTVDKSEARDKSGDESVDAEEGTTYADVAFVKGTRKGRRSNDVSGPNVDENTATYADMAFSNRAAVETTYADVRSSRDEDETTYADLTFVKKAGRGEEESAVFADVEEGSGREATYLTVTDIL